MKTILVLEDEPILMGFLRRVLGGNGYTVLEAASSKQAVQHFDDSGRQIDLLLADVSLPGMSGVQVACLFRSERPDLRVILMSGYPPNAWGTRDCEFLRTLESNPVSILLKPFVPQSLMRTINGLMQQAA
jgi:CheY-like chemotaxis protein